MTPASDSQHPQRASFSALTLSALGVVFGDIGTSPLYALKEGMSPAHGIPISEASVLGVLSLIVWTLTLVVSFKYAFLVMRADNQGEGGMLSIMTLASKGLAADSRARLAIVGLCLVGASLFYGDSVVTPAISVISAVEGLEVISPAFHNYILPIALAILLGLFMAQKLGTGRVGKYFGPITVQGRGERRALVKDDLDVFHSGRRAIHETTARDRGVVDPTRTGFRIAPIDEAVLRVVRVEGHVE